MRSAMTFNFALPPRTRLSVSAASTRRKSGVGFACGRTCNSYANAGPPRLRNWSRTRTVWIYREDGSVTHLREEDELTAEDLLPGFRCRVAELFPPQPASSG